MGQNLDPLVAELEPQQEELNMEIKQPLEQYIQKGKQNYLENEESGMDRLQDRIAATIEKYNPEPENNYVQGLTDRTSDFSKGLIQGAAGSLSAPGAIYDGLKELTEEDYTHSVSFYDQMERQNQEKNLPRKIGEATGFTAGAALGVQNPELFLTGAAQNGRHIGERKIHDKARDHFYEEPTAS